MFVSSLTGLFDDNDQERKKWDQYYASLPLAEEDAIIKAVNIEFAEMVGKILPERGEVLEAGCGGGWQSLALARTGKFHVTLGDFSRPALQYAQRLFQREAKFAKFIQEDILSPATPDYDLVFNAGVLEHYTLEDQIRFLKGMASRSRKYVLIVVPNSLCYWYWLWRIQMAGQGAWPFGKEVPFLDMASLFKAAGVHFIGQTFMGAVCTENFINSIQGIDYGTREQILKIHRSGIIPSSKSYLVAGLGCVSAEHASAPPAWTSEPSVRESIQLAELTASLADALALDIGLQTRLSQLQNQVAIKENQIAELEKLLRGKGIQ